jgi:hypothetical protein
MREGNAMRGGGAGAGVIAFFAALVSLNSVFSSVI